MGKARWNGDGNRNRRPLTWETHIPLLRSGPVALQLGIAMLVPTLLAWALAIGTFWASGNLTRSAFWMLTRLFGIILSGLLGIAMAALGLMRPRRHMRYTLDTHGITAVLAPRQHLHLGLLFQLYQGVRTRLGENDASQTPDVTEQVLPWDQIDAVVARPQSLQLVLTRKGRPVMLIQCTKSSFPEALDMIDHSLAA